jgi:LPS O-antigen subunit length determinant protein (WzzB/FepE family)
MTQDIKDIKPPIDIPSVWTWLWILLAGVVVIALLAWLVVWFLKKPKQEKAIEIAPLSSWEKAYARLENLRLKNLMERACLKPFYIELSDIIRQYLEERFSLKAPEMTTEEFLDSLRRSPVLNDAQQQTLKEFLYISDMVKFAKLEPSAFEAQRSFNLVKLLIDQTCLPAGIIYGN